MAINDTNAVINYRTISGHVYAIITAAYTESEIRVLLKMAARLTVNGVNYKLSVTDGGDFARLIVPHGNGKSLY